MPAALTIAGSDSGGGAGIQADLKTFEAHGVFGCSVITALTAQNTVGVQQVMPVPLNMVEAQMESVLSDLRISAVKTGMLFSAEIIRAVAKRLNQAALPLVVDPVMVATSGDLLLQQDAVEEIHRSLLPVATLVTPNLHEAALLSGITLLSSSDMLRAAEAIAKPHPGLAVLVKGGHLPGDPSAESDTVKDLFYHNGKHFWLTETRISTINTHGTGCTLAAAITARLAMGNSPEQSVLLARAYLQKALAMAWDGIGQGRGSLRHNLRLSAVE